MYEHTTLQEAYTGSLIAGKGKGLNNIKAIMNRSILPTEEWTRVRFGAGTPWRRCWCVVTPPNEKEAQKQQKSLKKKSVYDRAVPVFKGDVKFYDTKKTKKVDPIATIKDAYSAYAIYPQSKPLIDQSTLVKIEGVITIHSNPETTTEGFIFVMPETRPAITGFEMMLRFLFPVYDVFGLYGRPTRLIADTLDTKSLMFAMPQERRYGYLEIFDVATLIHTEGSQTWNEKEWRKQLKLLTAQRMAKIQPDVGRTGSRMGSHRSHRNSLPSRTGQLRFEDGASMRSTPSLHREIGFTPAVPPHTGSAPAAETPSQQPQKSMSHQRSVSEVTPFGTPRRQRTLDDRTIQNYQPSRLSYEQSRPADHQESLPPPPPVHSVPVAAYRNPQVQRYTGDADGANERSSSESERYRSPVETVPYSQNIEALRPNSPPAPVATPPAFAHQPGEKPQTRPYHSPELRRAKSRMSSTTLSQLAAAGNPAGPSGAAAAGGIAMAGAAAAWKGSSPQLDGRRSEDQSPRGANNNNNFTSNSGPLPNQLPNEGMALAGTSGPQTREQRQVASNLTINPGNNSSAYSSDHVSSPHSYLAPSPISTRSVSPLSQSTTHATSPAPQEISPAVVAPVFPHDGPEAAQLPSIDQHTREVIASDYAPPPVPAERPDELRRHSTSRSITRKPLPSPSRQSISNLTSDKSTVGDESRLAVHDSLLDGVDNRTSRRSSDSGDDRRSGDSSYYDNESVASPDYASTRQSTDTRRSAGVTEKPRTGVLKTVGTVDPAEQGFLIGDVRYQPGNGQQSSNANIPNVDFGPTQAYRPGTLQQHGRTGSSGRPQYTSQSDTQQNEHNNRLSGRDPITPEPGVHHPDPVVTDSDNRRSLAWSPGMAAGVGSPGARPSITPEQFVQQRAAANRVVPVYAHNRQQSQTPPHTSRQSSGDWSGQYPRPESPARPHSRGVSTVMGASADYSQHLSAREQEHVARVTGSPLINMAGSNKNQVPQGTGLVGAIEAREREKKEIKQGLSGQMVQQAIAQRQQHAQAQGYPNQTAYYPQPSPVMHIPGQFPQTPQTPYGGWTPQTQQFAMHPQHMHPYSPGANVYWNTAAPSYPTSPGRQQAYRHSQHQDQYQEQYEQDPQQQQQLQQQPNPYFNNNVQGGR